MKARVALSATLIVALGVLAGSSQAKHSSAAGLSPQAVLDWNANAVTLVLQAQHPREVTAEWAVDKRVGKVFVDYNQNIRGKTLASIYSPRARFCFA